MKYTKLGNSDLNVSRICMGCMGFGDPSRGQHSWTIDEAHTREIIKRGLELGVNFYDTAIAYQSGTSEQYVGRALRDFAKRDDVVVATKFLPRTTQEIEDGVTGQKHIESMINKSLSNLGMDYVDLYIYHMWDWNTPIEDILDGLNRVVKAGKARYIGISNCFAWQLAKANAIAEREGFAKFVSVQGHYNLIFREEEREMVPYCREENIALTPYSALASGRLSRRMGESGTKRAAEDAYAKFKYDATAQQDGVIIDRVAELSEKHGVTMTEISLAWLLTKVTSPVVGATKLHHIEGAAKAVELTLSDEEIAYLEEPYVPHPLAGVMAQNKRENAKEKYVWSTGNQIGGIIDEKHKDDENDGADITGRFHADLCRLRQ
ncbi:MAG: aldo/keto reductase [Ruminococcus sp.]|nr:aldo/keto reductase [Ruminococcus sp.]